MAVSRTNAYKEEKRQYYKAAAREGMFVADFVKTKYPDIYGEAALLYNTINEIHPNKPNIRKTTEYRMWKNQMAEANNQPIHPIPRQRSQYIKRTEYPNISTGSNTTGETDTENTPSPTSPKETNPLTGPKQFVLEIPLMPKPKTQKSTHETVPTQSSVEEGEQQETHVVEEGQQMETLVVEEGEQLETLDPSLMDVVPPDVVERIISDLQRDPCLKEIMDDLEKQFVHDEEIIGLEVDIPDMYDPLEEELENLMW